jgi:hypothetical protein
METIAILGKQHVAAAPSFGLREQVSSELVMAQKAADGMRCLRLYAAAIGLSCGVGKLAGASMGRADWDVVAYGDAVYSYLREQGVGHTEITKAGVEVVGWFIDALFPREDEVSKRVGFSEGGEGQRTSSPPG